MFLSTLYISISRSIDGGRAFSTLEIWSCVFQSRVFSVPVQTWRASFFRYDLQTAKIAPRSTRFLKNVCNRPIALIVLFT